jgi:hypothetical protein
LRFFQAASSLSSAWEGTRARREQGLGALRRCLRAHHSGGDDGTAAGAAHAAARHGTRGLRASGRAVSPASGAKESKTLGGP